MKRIISCLLAVVLVCTPCLHVCATESGENVMGNDVLSNGQEESRAESEIGDMEQTRPAEINGMAEETGEMADGNSKDGDTESGDGFVEPNSEDGDTVPGDGLVEPISEMANDESKEPETKAAETASVGNLGQVDVSIVSALILERDVTFTVSLGEETPREVTLARDDGTVARVEKAGVSFENLVAGSYTLTVSAPGFATYTQTVEVNDQAYFLQLTTGFVGNYTYEAGEVHPGVILLGDVNGDGTIDTADKDDLVSAIDQGTTDGTGDLNGDGVSDLADLEYFAASYQLGEGMDMLSAVEYGVPAKAMTVKEDANTQVEGSLETLLTNEGGAVTLRPVNGAISGDNPVVLVFDFKENVDYSVGAMLIEMGMENPVRALRLDVEYEEGGKNQTATVPLVVGVDPLLVAEQMRASLDENGTITVDFGTQIAVKKVSLVITGMQNNNNLAEITKVEFLNNLQNRIPAPDMDIPEGVSAVAGNKSFTLTWNACRNITGYEVRITYNGLEEVRYTKSNSLAVTAFNKEKLVNNESYTVEVRSVNGTWRSPYSAAIEVVPKTDKKPDAPDGLNVTGNYRAIDASWKKMEDTDTYNLYYREEGMADFTKVEGITSNQYTLSNLKDKTAYEIYVTGVNELGEGARSLTAKAETTDPNPADMSKYKLLNTGIGNEADSHIVSATYTHGDSMQDSPLDTKSGTAWGTVDKNPVSAYFWNTWDQGGFNAMGDRGMTYEFDQAYKIQSFALQEVSVQSVRYGYIRVRYWDAENENQMVELGHDQVSLEPRTDEEGRLYYMVKLPKAVTTSKIQFALARSVANGTISISEVYFYHYDSLEDDIMALYADDLHTVLCEGAEGKIEELQNRIDTKDPVSGEYHPDKEKLQRELDTAKQILRAELSDPVRVHGGITTGDVNRGFGGLNAWQPLGVTVAAGEQITVYVGHNTKKTGDNTQLQLVVTQYHAESSNLFNVVKTLKIGKNDITIPKLISTDVEKGGALYVQYTGSGNDEYAVRVEGGVEVPILDLYQVTGEERLQRTQEYIEDLKVYTAKMEEVHDQVHAGSDNTSVDYAYEDKNCILGASDIMLDTMLLSLPAQQILAGAGNSAQTLLDSLDAMEEMIDLFYQHKGLTEKETDGSNAISVKDRYPSMHLNIRYQRMFAGAFMYASGNHVGIEWNETRGMASGASVQADADGRYQSGHYFGWGIAHEIGHCINQGAYAVAEVTNNYYSVLAQAQDNNESVRFQYGKVYEKVTSGTKGRASNVFTQLGMYWQLHLAYDDGYNYKTYESYTEQLENLFFARVDTYARETTKAPAPGGIALELTGDTDQNLMRLSCAAAEKNLLTFFERWGMTPNEETNRYAGQFAEETRALYYVDDDSRVYRLTHGGSRLTADGTTEVLAAATSAQIDADAKNQVNFQFVLTDAGRDDILGYEIVRCTMSGNEVDKVIAGFTTESTFSDFMTTMNNRVVTYEITAIDKYLNRSAVLTLDPLKIEHTGNIDKAGWTVSASGITSVAEDYQGGEEDPCAKTPEKAINKVIDNNSSTTYLGTAGQNAEVVVEFNRQLTITGFEYKADLNAGGEQVQDYTVYVRNAQNGWTEAASGTFETSGGKAAQTVYFSSQVKGNIAAYDTTAMKLLIKNKEGKQVAITELDVLGVTGDNVELQSTLNGTPAIGKLTADYKYGTNAKDVIPAGSIIFTGVYKGNPAYNLVLLYDQDGNIVSGTSADGEQKAYHVIQANVPDDGEIQEVYDGTWIYWIEPQDTVNLEALTKVRAELYRVDDAMTNQGQRLVSDSFFVNVEANSPEELRPITLTSSQSGGN